jgi:hypothetical protein
VGLTTQVVSDSSDLPLVDGPSTAIDNATIPMLAAISSSAPETPARFSAYDTRKPLKMPDSRLHDYTKPIARARIRVG